MLSNPSHFLLSSHFQQRMTPYGEGRLNCCKALPKCRCSNNDTIKIVTKKIIEHVLVPKVMPWLLIWMQHSLQLYSVPAWLLSCVQLFATPWTVAHQAPLSMKFSRQEYWSRLPFPTPGIFPTQELNLHLFVPPALVISFFTTAPPGKSSFFHRYIQHIKHILYAQEAKRETLPRPWTGSDLKEVNSLGPCNNTGHSPFLAPWS